MNITIVGAGEVGYHIASTLSRENNDVVLIDKSADKIKYVFENLDVKTIHGSGSSPTILKEAGIESGDMLIAVADSDEINMMACLFANMLSPHTIKIARIRNPEFLENPRIFGPDFLNIHLIINPEVEVVKTILRLMEVPGASDVIDFAEGKVKLVGIKVLATSLMAGLKLKDLDKKGLNHELLIAAIVRGNQMIIPRGEDTIMSNDLVYVVTEKKRIPQVLKLFGKKGEPVHRILIIGGGDIGTALATELEKKHVSAKIIEKDAERCTYLAEQLEKTVVLEGDGTEQALLQEENIQDMDFVMSATGDQENNVLISLLAQGLGARKTITRIDKFSYIPLASAIGLDIIVSPRLSAVSTILQYTRKGRILSVVSLKGEDAEAIEVLAMETSDIVGSPLREIKFPKGAIIAAIVRRDEVIIPSGESVIAPQDRIIIFSSKESVPEVEKALMVKLEYF